MTPAPNAGGSSLHSAHGTKGSLWTAWVEHAARTAIAAGVSLGCARLMRLPEAYWAPISTIVVMQSTLGAAWEVSKNRIIGTALGAAAGGLLASYVAPRVLAFAGAILVLGLVCALLRLDRSAYRFAGITLAIVALVERTSRPYLIAAHRFAEVSLGIAVALVLTAVWPGREEGSRG